MHMYIYQQFNNYVNIYKFIYCKISLIFIHILYFVGQIASPYMKLDEDYELFQNLLLEHSIDRPHFSKKYFSLDQIAKITEYATNTYENYIFILFKKLFKKKSTFINNNIKIYYIYNEIIVTSDIIPCTNTHLPNNKN